MESDDADSSAIIKQINHTIQGFSKDIQFTVQFDSDCLKSSFCRMSSGRLNLHRNGLTDDLCQFSGCLNRCLCSRSHNMLRNIFCKFIFSVITNDPVKFFFVVAIDNISSRTTLSLIHSHVKRCIYPVGKATFFVIQLIR